MFFSFICPHTPNWYKTRRPITRDRTGEHGKTKRQKSCYNYGSLGIQSELWGSAVDLSITIQGLFTGHSFTICLSQSTCRRLPFPQGRKLPPNLSATRTGPLWEGSSAPADLDATFNTPRISFYRQNVKGPKQTDSWGAARRAGCYQNWQQSTSKLLLL